MAALPLISEQAEAVSSHSQDIAPNGYLVLQMLGSSDDVILTDETGYIDYMNGGLSNASYSVLGTFLDTRRAAFYGEIGNGTNYLIIDNTFQGSAQPNGQTAQVTYDARSIIVGIQTSSEASISISGILFMAGIVILFAIAAFVSLVAIDRMRQSRLPFYQRHDRHPSRLQPFTRGSVSQKPHRIYLQANTAVQPILVHAIGRCPNCNGIIANEWTQCTKCGWIVDLSGLRPFEQKSANNKE